MAGFVSKWTKKGSNFDGVDDGDALLRDMQILVIQVQERLVALRLITLDMLWMFILGMNAMYG